MLGKAVKDYLCKSAEVRKEQGQTLPKDFYTRGRESWDPMLVMAAFFEKYPKAFEYRKGKATVDENGANYFEEDANGVDRYALKVHNNEYYQEIIDGIIKE